MRTAGNPTKLLSFLRRYTNMMFQKIVVLAIQPCLRWDKPIVRILRRLRIPMYRRDFTLSSVAALPSKRAPAHPTLHSRPHNEHASVGRKHLQRVLPFCARIEPTQDSRPVDQGCHLFFLSSFRILVRFLAWFQCKWPNGRRCGLSVARSH